MWIFDLKTLLFVLLLVLGVAVGGTIWLMRRRVPAGAALPRASLLSVLANAPVGVLVLEGERVQYANPYTQHLLRLPGETGVLPQTDWTGLLDEDREMARHFRMMHQTAGGARYRTVTFASGQTARWWVQPWEEDSPLATGRDFVFLLDITVQQQTEQAARALVNDMSHELRTPIATLLTHLEILGLSDVGAEVRQQSLALSKDEARRMARLVNDMLELGRLETAGELSRRPLDLLTLVEDVVLQSTPRAVERQMALAVEADAPLPLVIGNADRLRQVFLNLLDNTFKYARPGDRVVVSLKRGEDDPQAQSGVVCAVCDTGPGIPPEHLPYLTRRFYRAAPNSIEGSGLGLALVAEILRRHDSKLEIESRTMGETGTCVRFVIRET